MIPRPKNTDTMADVLKMQNDYLKQKSEENFKPAAQTINKSVNSSAGKFCWFINVLHFIAFFNCVFILADQKQSVFAKRRNLKQSDADKKQKKLEVIGDVVERKYENESMEMEYDDESFEDHGFPKPKPIDVRSFKGTLGKSIFSQMMSKTGVEACAEEEQMETEGESDPTIDLQKIDEENNRILSGMSQEEILEEQAKLLKSLDPKLIEFMRLKQKLKDQQKTPSAPPRRPVPAVKPTAPEDFPDLDFLKDEQAKNWLHFDVLEPEKLEWTRNIEKTFANLKPGESFEARFDWKGFLLPFIYTGVDIEPSGNIKDDRELYLHGDDPHRPGYSLQELFRLARATVLQQRVAAINAIAGIINIYNQGYYDGILELPMSKIFFFLRFAMDENTPAIVEVSSRALAFLFYNDTDETLLDIAYETKNGLIQPILDNRKASVSGTAQDEMEMDLESSLKNLTLEDGKKLFESKLEDYLDDGEQEKGSVDDFHMAEVNLAECLMRTNILERISYILTVTKPNDVTIHSCVKILIRLARVSRDFALRILNKNNLIEQMIPEFLSSIEGHQEPHFIVLKLFRILSSYDRTFCLKLKNLKVVEIAKTFVATRKDVNVNLLKLQIESFRFLRLYFHLFPDETSYSEMIMPIRYLLEWHYQHLDFQRDNHFIIRQHASSLLYLLGSGNLVVTFPIFSETFKMCCCKWFTMATRGGANEFSQKLLLSTVLDVGGPFVSFAAEYFYDFIDDYLMKFLKSPYYQRMASELCTATPLFHSGVDRCNIYKPLVNLGSIIRRHKKSAPTLVLSQEYSIYFMQSLLIFIDSFDNMNTARNYDYHHKLCDIFYSEDVEKYLEGFSIQVNRSLTTNWFLKTEIIFIYNLLNSRSLQFNPWLLKVAFNLLNCLTQENLPKIFYIFKNFIFNDRYYFKNEVKAEEFERWKYIYNGVVMSKLKEASVSCTILKFYLFLKLGNFQENSKNVAVVENWNQVMLNESWPYSLLLILLYHVEVDASQKRVVETELTEEEIIKTSLKFTLLLEKNKVSLITTNQQFMYLMLVYFGKNLNFLDPPVKLLIGEKMKAMKKFPFPTRFNIKLNKEKSFESLYTMFLDTFQGNSYGDDLFSVLVMIPLAQKYEAKWRKLVWSEYVTTMKFISCQEKDLIEDINEYLHPVETDVSILKSYVNALSTNLLRKDSIPWKIAEHHVRNAKKS